MDKAILKLLASKIASMIGGPFVWLWTKLLFYGGQALINFLDDIIRKAKRTKVQEEAKQVLEQKEADPKSTVDERGKAYEDFINSGRT